MMRGMVFIRYIMMRIIVSLSLQERQIRADLREGIDKSILYLNWSRVIYVESLGNHTVIHTLDQEFESTESLKLWKTLMGTCSEVPRELHGKPGTCPFYPQI